MPKFTTSFDALIGRLGLIPIPEAEICTIFHIHGNLPIESCREYREIARRYEALLLRGLAGRNRVRVIRSMGADVFDVSVDQLVAHTRDAEMTAIRQKLMAVAFVLTGASFGRIGEEFNRDHSAVSYAYDKYGSAVRAALAE